MVHVKIGNNDLQNVDIVNVIIHCQNPEDLISND